MTQSIPAISTIATPTPSSPYTPVKFDKSSGFQRTLRERVDAYFASTRRKPRDCWQMYAKAATTLALLATTYLLMLFVPGPVWLTIFLAVLVGLAAAMVGFNVQHDGGHRAFSRHRLVNKLAALTLDMLGASSYVWARKHNTIHHSYTNITGHDDDIDVGPFGRLSPHQRRLKLHRLQHFYLWFLYGFLPMKWHLYDDFRSVIVGRIGSTRLPRPRGLELAILIGGKALFFTLALAIPMLLLPWWLVLLCYAVASFVQGVVLSVVFQLAHCVEEAEFPMPRPDTHRIENCWAVHQIETTVDFAPRSRVLSWLVGGLNCQVEHHLFPQICHIHYPRLSRVVEDTCREFGVTYLKNNTLFDGIASHYRWLRRMGQPDLTAA